jgi:hypothetical protein
MDVSQIGLHFEKGELDRVEVEADLAGLQLQGSTLPEQSREQIMRAADRLLRLVTRELKREIREGLKG